MTNPEPTDIQLPDGNSTRPQLSYTYREMFEMLKDGRAKKVCRQEGNSAWIVNVDGNFYREIYDSKTWLVHYDLLSTDEFQKVVDKLLSSVTPSIEAK